MKWYESDLVAPVTIGLIENEKSYWANHFYSVIECFNSHKNLQHSPRQFDTFPIWSLNDMRGYLPPNFFDVIHSYLYNWGFQYFLVSFLNTKMSSNIVSELVKRLSDLYSTIFPKELNEYKFYISGHDSALSYDLQDRFTKVFPIKLMGQEPTVDKLIKESDLCLVLRGSETNEKIGIFGEVEGVYGNKLRNKSFWDEKQNFCIYGFGVIDGSGKQCLVENRNVDNIDRVNFYFEKKNFVVKDFYLTLEYFKLFFLYGPTTNIKTNNEEFDFFLNKIKEYWFKPSIEFINYLKLFIDNSDILGKFNNALSVITSIQA